MPKFRREWTYRTPTVTVTYPVGWGGKLPKDRYDAARAAGALKTRKNAEEPEEPAETENADGDDVDGNALGGEGRSDAAEGG